jgi:hypothetical protein
VVTISYLCLGLILNIKYQALLIVINHRFSNAKNITILGRRYKNRKEAKEAI